MLEICLSNFELKFEKKYKILFIASGPAAPGTTTEDNPFYFLSDSLSGDVIGSTWNNSSYIDYINQIQSSFGDFTYHAFKRSNLPSIFRNVIHFFKYLWLGSKVIKQDKVDVIISYGFLVTGLSSAVLSWLYSIPLIVEVPGVQEKAIKFSSSKFSKITEALLFFSIRTTLKQAKTVWCLFENQLPNKFSTTNKKVFVFHEFAPVSMYKPQAVEDNIISFLGFPWKLKGVDILIDAFKKISLKFPDAKLRIAGYCPNKEEFTNQAIGFENKIEFFPSMERNESINFMRSTRIFVLPSRTEAMGRVLLEAMASEKVIIGSNVDGIPHYITNDETGLLFESENVNDLARQLESALGNSKLYDRLSKNAHSKLLNNYTEKHFVEKFHKMIDETLSNS